LWVRYSVLMRTCDHCKTELIYTGKGRPPTRFCSRKCKDAVKHLERRAAAVVARGERRCRVCANIIPDTVTLKAACCSRACGVTYQNQVRADAKRAVVLAERKPCEYCQGPIPETRRGGSIYCSWRCKHNAVGAEQRKTSPGYMRQYMYGVTEAQYVEMLEQQGHACAICESTDWAGRHGSPHVDHDHVTGVVRGLLCGNCNNGLGHFKDDPARLLAAIAYLEKSRGVP
jgi:hypothetical protein